MTQQRGARPQSQRGDTTGRLKEALTAQHEDAVEQRRGELGMINASKAAVKQDGVIDLTGDVPTLEGTDQLVDTSAREPNVIEREAEPQGRNINTGHEATAVVEELPQPKASGGLAEVLTEDDADTPTTIESLFDLEDITLGIGNTVTLKAGYKYRLPAWMAKHLDERHLVNIKS